MLWSCLVSALFLLCSGSMFSVFLYGFLGFLTFSGPYHFWPHWPHWPHSLLGPRSSSTSQTPIKLLSYFSHSSPCSLICLKWLSRLIINLLSSPPSLLFLISLRGPADFSELLQVRKMPQKGPWVPTRGGGAHSLILVGPPRYKDLCWAVDLLLTKIFSSASS